MTCIPGRLILLGSAAVHWPHIHSHRYQGLLDKVYVQDNPNLKWCTAPDCTYAIECDISQNSLSTIVPTVTCECGHVMCFGCDHENHQVYKGGGDAEHIYIKHHHVTLFVHLASKLCHGQRLVEKEGRGLGNGYLDFQSHQRLSKVSITYRKEWRM